jgi:hypothetical protein
MERDLHQTRRTSRSRPNNNPDAPSGETGFQPTLRGCLNRRAWVGASTAPPRGTVNQIQAFRLNLPQDPGGILPGFRSNTSIACIDAAFRFSTPSFSNTRAR